MSIREAPISIPPPRTARRRSCAAAGWIGVLALLCLLPTGTASGQDRSLEYKIKAAYLYNFTKYIEWPEALSQPSAPFVIGVLGPDPAGDYLRAIAQIKTVGDRPLRIRHFPDLERLQYCPILFMSDQVAAEDQKKALAAFSAQPTLTVGESPEFTAWGGVIRFKIHEDRVNLVISQPACDQAGLVISSKLLQLDVVEIAK